MSYLFGNFLAAARKLNLRGWSGAGIPSLFNLSDSVAFIADNTTGVALVAQAVAGTVDGSNAVFTTPSYSNTCFIYKNGVLQTQNVMYTLSGTTLTFLIPYIPQAGDVILAVVS